MRRVKAGDVGVVEWRVLEPSCREDELSTKRGCFVDGVDWEDELSTKRGCFVEEIGLGTLAWLRDGVPLS